MVLAQSVLVAGMLLLAVLMLSRLGTYEAAASQAQERLSANKARVKEQEQTLSLRQKDPQLVTRLESLKLEQEDLLRIEQTLQAGECAGAGAGCICPGLYALARQPLPGVWLTSITVEG